MYVNFLYLQFTWCWGTVLALRWRAKSMWYSRAHPLWRVHFALDHPDVSAHWYSFLPFWPVDAMLVMIACGPCFTRPSFMFTWARNSHYESLVILITCAGVAAAGMLVYAPRWHIKSLQKCSWGAQFISWMPAANTCGVICRIHWSSIRSRRSLWQLTGLAKPIFTSVLDVHIGVKVFYHFNVGFCNGLKESPLAPFLDLTKNIVPVTLHVVHTICTSSGLWSPEVFSQSTQRVLILRRNEFVLVRIHQLVLA